MSEDRLFEKASSNPRGGGAAKAEAISREAHAAEDGGRTVESAAARQAMESPGSPLEAETRAIMQPRFGHDFSRVRVHADPLAAESAKSVNAEAYTVGHDVVFGPGRYDPRSGEGQRLIAHELAHVVQNQTGPAAAGGAPEAVSRSDSRAEIEAGEVAGHVIRELPARIESRPAAGIQRQISDPSSTKPPVTETAFDIHARSAGWHSYQEFMNSKPFVTPNPTFLGLPVHAHKSLVDRLKVAEGILAKQGLADHTKLGITEVKAYQGGDFHGLHSFGAAIDIDAATNPFIAHEHNEKGLDKELEPVYQRIARFILGTDSIIPGLKSQPPTTGNPGDRAGRFYDNLLLESDAMKQYFQYMQNAQELNKYLNSPDGYARAQNTSTFGSILNAYDLFEPATEFQWPPPSPITTRKVDFIRRRMMLDWVILTGEAGPNVASVSTAIYPGDPLQLFSMYPRVHPAVPDKPGEGSVDRPFDTHSNTYAGRTPLAGFLNLRKELVLAMVGAGLSWGAIDFGGESGDIMHFDTRTYPPKP